MNTEQIEELIEQALSLDDKNIIVFLSSAIMKGIPVLNYENISDGYFFLTDAEIISPDMELHLTKTMVFVDAIEAITLNSLTDYCFYY